MPQLKLEEFHEALHSDLGKSYRPPEKSKSRFPKGHPARNNAGSSGPDRAHDLRWITATIKPRSSSIDVVIRLNFKTDGLSNNDANQLRSLAKAGIKRF